VWIQVASNLQAKLANATDAERAWLAEYLNFDNQKAHFTGGPSKYRMFNVFASAFPAGFLPMVEKAAADAGFKVQRLDTRKAPAVFDSTADLAWLRDDQLEAVETVVAKARGILWMPTGSGKTEVAVGLVLALPCLWLFMVHRTNLVDQAAERYERRTGLRAGRIGEGQWDVPADASFVCATFQTMAQGLDKKDPRVLALLSSARGLVIDECHTLPAASFYRVAMSTENAYFRVGLSGTPLARGDRRSQLAVAALGPILYRVKTSTLVDAGILSKGTIHLVEVPQRFDLPTWQGVYGAAVVRSAPRNRAIIACARRTEKPAVVFVKEIAHGKLLEKALLKAGIPTGFVWGTHSNDYRKTRVRDLVAGRVDVLVCSVVFQEGIDIPELRSVVVGSGGKSVIAALQRIGRGMRRTDGKTTFDVWDIADKGCGCTTPEKHTGCKWLEAHTAQRVRAYRLEGHTIVREAALLSGLTSA